MSKLTRWLSKPFQLSAPTTPAKAMKITLDENALSQNADLLFAGATFAKKNVAPVVALRNDSAESVTFNVVLKNGTVENQNASIPPGGIAVIQAGGEINVMSDFGDLYENVQEGIASELSSHTSEAVTRAGINSAQAPSLTRLTASPKQRIDQYLKLPTAPDGSSIDFVIMKPWGENGSLIPQDAKSGDVLVLNGTNKSLYFNSTNGTLGNFVNVESGNPIPQELATMKTAPLKQLLAAAKVENKPDGLEHLTQ